MEAKIHLFHRTGGTSTQVSDVCNFIKKNELRNCEVTFAEGAYFNIKKYYVNKQMYVNKTYLYKCVRSNTKHLLFCI